MIVPRDWAEARAQQRQKRGQVTARSVQELHDRLRRAEGGLPMA